MVVPNREIANSNISTYTLAMSYPVEFKVNSENIQIEALRDRSNITSTNLSRESSVLSKASSIEYAAHMEAQSADFNWANQTKKKLFKLSYMIPVERKSNIHSQANYPNSMPPPHVGHACNMQS